MAAAVQTREQGLGLRPGYLAGTCFPVHSHPYGQGRPMLRFLFQGVGLFVPVITFLSSIVAEALVEAIMRDKGYYEQHAWPTLAGFGLAAVAVAILARGFEHHNPTVGFDEKTGGKIETHRVNSFLGLPMHRWPVVLVGIGLVVFVVRVMM